MKLNSGHSLYQQADVACSTPQLTLMLYDGAIRYIREAVEHLRAGRLAEKGKAVESAFECILELRRGLDRTDGGEMVMRCHLAAPGVALAVMVPFSVSGSDQSQ